MINKEIVINPNLEEWEDAQAELLKNSLRSNEREIVQTVLDSVGERMGMEAANTLLIRVVNSLIEEKDFGFV